MTGLQKTTLGILSVLACALLLAGLFAAAQASRVWSRQPLGPRLVLPTAWQLPPTWTASPALTQPAFTPITTSTLEASTATPASPFLACPVLPTMTVLAVGTDARSDEYRFGRADFIRAVRVDFGLRRVTTLEFPRDLWVRIPGLEQIRGTDHQKLNTAYTYGNPDDGPGLLAATLEANFGLKVDHYMVVNMNVFVDVVDALGGLDITLPPGGIDGRTSGDRSERLVFPEDEQHLTGEQALTLARIRNVSVFQRAEHQNMVMCALRRQIESPEMLLRLPAILDSFMDNILTDLTPGQISQLACLGTRMPRANILFAAFPPALLHTSKIYDPVLEQEVFVWEADFDALRRHVTQFQAGTWPSRSPSGTPEPQTNTCE
jgi:LCP family protein required for cell wall assembly